MQKDMKIGMLAGLLLAVGVMIYVCTRPAFSPRARILNKENLRQQQQTAEQQDQQQKQIERLITFGPATAGAKRLDTQMDTPESETTVPEALVRKDSTGQQEKPRFVQKLPLFEEQKEQIQSLIESGPFIEQQPRSQSVGIEEPPVRQYKARKFYIVRKGDTLSKISKKYYGNANLWHTIYEANRDIISNPDRIQIGMKLYIPD